MGDGRKALRRREETKKDEKGRKKDRQTDGKKMDDERKALR